jgi:hypothetical protein
MAVKLIVHKGMSTQMKTPTCQMEVEIVKNVGQFGVKRL